MLSILIPVYNYNIVRLVKDLHHQAMESFADFEILVMEDGSVECLEENKQVAELEFCTYIVLEKNIGRSAIRNKLADTARYENLLFLDCDAEVSNQFFIQKYLSFVDDDCVVLGGRTYDETDFTPNKSLVITYGVKRERYNQLKSLTSHKMFMSPNFLIKKSTFNKVRFNEKVKGYGHEDSIFGIELERLGIPILHIDNPVIHKGLEDNDTYLQKTQKALSNLNDIYRSGQYPEIAQISKVLRMMLTLKKYHLSSLVHSLFVVLRPLILKNLHSKRPNLTLLDFYKLGYLIEFNSKK